MYAGGDIMLDDDHCESLYNYYKKNYKGSTFQIFRNLTSNKQVSWIIPSTDFWLIPASTYVQTSTYENIRFTDNITFKELCEKLDITNEIIIKFLLENV